MQSWALLRSNPYMAKSDEHGRFEVKNLPTGKQTFQFWHEREGYLRNLNFGDHKTNAPGRLEVMLGDEKLQLADMKLAPEMFVGDK